MTREQALYDDNWCEKISKNLVNIHINQIYDDFENRICKNCLFYKDNICCNGDSYLRAEPVDEDFGCVLFKRRENERGCC